MLGLLLALGAGLYLASRGIVRIGAEKPPPYLLIPTSVGGAAEVWVYQHIWDYSPERGWTRRFLVEQHAGPKLMPASQVSSQPMLPGHPPGPPYVYASRLALLPDGWREVYSYRNW